jgi:hypothetical protein
MMSLAESLRAANFSTLEEQWTNLLRSAWEHHPGTNKESRDSRRDYVIHQLDPFMSWWCEKYVPTHLYQSIAQGLKDTMPAHVSPIREVVSNPDAAPKRSSLKDWRTENRERTFGNMDVVVSRNFSVMEDYMLPGWDISIGNMSIGQIRTAGKKNKEAARLVEMLLPFVEGKPDTGLLKDHMDPEPLNRFYDGIHKEVFKRD